MSRLLIRDLSFLDWKVEELSVSKGEVVAVLGESGSGKSLFLRAMADLIVSEGEVSCDGVSRGAMPVTEWRRKVGYLPAEILWWKDRVADHFLSSPDVDTLAGLGLGTEVLDWEASRLSMGERQRLGLLRLLDREPAALLLDEPTSNLDEVSMGRVEKTLLSYVERTGASAVWVTHSQEQAMRVATRRFLMAGKGLGEVSDV